MLLGIDTCGGAGSIALARSSGGQLDLVVQAALAGKSYSAQLVPKIQELLQDQGCGPESLQAIVVVHGPGSFTGVRVGLSVGKGLAEALDISLLAVSRLAVLAAKAEADAAVLDAGRGEFYFRAQEEEALFTPAEIRERLSGTLAVCEEIVQRAFPEAVFVEPPSAADALAYAVPRLVAKDFDDVATLDGNYVRRSDAELFLKQGVRVAGAGSVESGPE